MSFWRKKKKDGTGLGKIKPESRLGQRSEMWQMSKMWQMNNRGFTTVRTEIHADLHNLNKCKQEMEGKSMQL